MVKSLKSCGLAILRTHLSVIIIINIQFGLIINVFTLLLNIHNQLLILIEHSEDKYFGICLQQFMPVNFRTWFPNSHIEFHMEFSCSQGH